MNEGVEGGGVEGGGVGGAGGGRIEETEKEKEVLPEVRLRKGLQRMMQTERVGGGAGGAGGGARKHVSERMEKEKISLEGKSILSVCRMGEYKLHGTL